MKGWDWQKDTLLPVFLQKSFVCCATSLGKRAFERRRAELQEFDSDLERREKAGHILFVWVCFFLKTQKTEKTVDIIIQQGCGDMNSHTRPFQFFTSGASLAWSTLNFLKQRAKTIKTLQLHFMQVSHR